MISETIKNLANQLQEELIQVRRDIHQSPELGHEEYETCAYIQKQLAGLGLEVQGNVAGTGVVALLKGSQEGRTVMLRADIDALPIEEKTGLPFSSLHKGKMHACGHDAHTAILIGAAKLLVNLREHLKGNVKFVFQPAEEANPTGAGCMLEDGVMENPTVDAVVATHMWPDIPAGQYGVRMGSVMAAPDFYRLEITGNGSHGSQPEKGIDPILIGHEIYSAFQNIPTHFAGVLNPIVVSVTSFRAGTCNNAFPDTSLLEGTVRSYDEKLRSQIPVIMEDIIRSIVTRYGASYEFSYRMGAMAVVNDEKIARLTTEAITKLYGADSIAATPYPAMTGEDFSLFMQHAPGVYFWTGVKNKEKNCIYPLHDPRFTIDEDVLSQTAAAMAQIAVDYLEQENN
ncbi:MAG: M20 metallopeptidase family protein [Lachnospiraceae bacterium]